MSKIIKAAQLQVLVPVSSDQVFRGGSSETSASSEIALQSEGTILQAASLIDDAKQKAAEIIEQARQEADQIIRKAEAKKTQIEKELDQVFENAQQNGFAAGYQEGLEAGYQEVKNQTAEFLASLDSIISAAVQKRSAALSRLEEDFLKLSLYIAEKLIKREIESDPAWLVPTIRSGLEQLANHDYVTIRVSPETYQTLHNASAYADVFSGRIRWESDSALGVNDCIIETEFGAIDASLDSRFAKLGAALREQIYVE